MNSSNRSWQRRLARTSITTRLGLLSILMLACFPLVLLLKPNDASFPDALSGAFLAFIVCWGVGAGSLMIANRFRSPEKAMVGFGIGMMLRMSAPFLVAIWIVFTNESLVEAGFIYYLLAFYLLMLLVETVLSVVTMDRSASAGSSEPKHEITKE